MPIACLCAMMHAPCMLFSCELTEIMCCRRRIAKATGGQMVLTLADMDGQETFEASALGTAAEVIHSAPGCMPPNASSALFATTALESVTATLCAPAL